MNNIKDDRLDEIIKRPDRAFLKKLLKGSIFIISPNDEQYQNDERKITYDVSRKCSYKLLIDLLTYDDSYELLKNMFNNLSNWLTVYFIDEDGQYKGDCRFNKKSFVEAAGSIELPENLKTKYKKLAELIYFDRYIQDHINEVYNIDIDKENYNINFKDMIEFLNLSDEQYNEIMSNENGLLYGIPKVKFIYAISKYFEKNKIENNYIIDSTISSRVSSIQKNEKIDIEAINDYNLFDDFNFNDIHVNEELKQYLLSDIPENLSDLEKAVFIYIKMCKTLTYDEEFYAMNQKGPVVAKHEDVNNVSNISLKNNKVVCYEFNAIYEKMLAEFGIKFKTKQKLMDGFGGGHANLTFRAGKFIIEADSVSQILRGDLMQAKLNQPLIGLKCINVNNDTKQEFKEMVSKVYSIISEMHVKRTTNDVEKIESFEDILKQYESLTENLKPVSLSDKIDILIKKVKSTNMVGVDALSYVLQLRKILFTEQEQKNNFRISIIKDSGINNRNEYATANAVFALRTPNNIDGNMEIHYFFYSPGKQLINITKAELQEMFDENKLGYVEKDDPVIPGIKGGR